MGNFIDQVYDLFESALGHSDTLSCELAEGRRSKEEEKRENEGQLMEMGRRMEEMRVVVLEGQEEMRLMGVKMEERELGYERGERETQ